MNPAATLTLTEQLLIRPIGPEDHQQHFALMQRIYPPAFGYLWPDDGAWYVNHIHRKEALEADLATPDAPYYHVYFAEDLVGIFRLKLHAKNPDFPEKDALKLDRLYLDDGIRSRGIGTTLINFTKAKAQQMGKELVWLERMDTNEATINFYQKNGFQPGGPFRLTYKRMPPRFRGMQRLWWPIPQEKS